MPKRGRPVLYKNVKDLEKIINNYFDECDEKYRPYTMSGLALALGMSRETLVCYGKNEKFSDAISKARQKVERCLEERLYGSSPTGVIFNLRNNFGWKEESTVNTKVTYEDRLKQVSDSDEY